jgi:hypothetical protein
MITKEQFIRFLKNYQTFQTAFNRIDEALMGKKYSSNFYESDLYESVGMMLDIFLETHFTNKGCDLIAAYLFEDVTEYYYQKPQTLFEESKEVMYCFETLDELYDVMLNFREDFFIE